MTDSKTQPPQNPGHITWEPREDEAIRSRFPTASARPATNCRRTVRQKYHIVAPSEVSTHSTTQPMPLPLPRRRVPKWVPNSLVLAGLARTDRTVTWTKPLVLGLAGLARTESRGLLIRRFWVQAPGGVPTKPQVKLLSGGQGITTSAVQRIDFGTLGALDSR